MKLEKFIFSMSCRVKPDVLKVNTPKKNKIFRQAGIKEESFGPPATDSDRNGYRPWPVSIWFPYGKELV